MRALWTSLATAFVLLAVGAAALGRVARGHFLPLQQMEQAVASGDGCALFLGDSRMIAAFDARALEAAERGAGREVCHAQLAIGGTDIAGAFVTLREYLARGPAPSVVVVGKVGDSLLGPPAPLTPEEMVGNNAIHLTWTRASDVFAEVPGFPFEDVGALDRGLRFLANRLTPLGRFQSLAALRVQRLTGALVGAGDAASNQFGSIGDMLMLEKGLRIRAPERLAEAVSGPESARLGVWFPRILSLLEPRRIPVLVVELPMRSTYLAHVTRAPATREYQRWLGVELARHGASLLDLSEAPWVADGLFADQLHIGPEGAARVSAAIGSRVAVDLATSARRDAVP